LAKFFGAKDKTIRTPSFKPGQPAHGSGKGDERARAEEWLKANGAPVTPANIDAVLKKVVLGGR
jgi:hypothetical protein